MGAKIAGDGQWRFPVEPGVPDKFEQALLQFEDEWFYYHPGVNPVSVFRAVWQNISAGEVVSGASTLTMQVIRLSRKNRPRTVWEKLKEMILALRLELTYSKQEILTLYAGHAPFGGNVVGLEAASWRYFGRSPEQLSWAEVGVLAVLPNSPSLIHPGRNREQLRQKRNRLLQDLLREQVIDALTFNLAKAEPLPDEPLPLPRIAPHLLGRIYSGGSKGRRVRSTIDRTFQQRVNRVVETHHAKLRQNRIHNAAVLVAEVRTGRVLAYVGNTQNHQQQHGGKVDVITAPRSTGSILKPFLYAWMLDEGSLLPHMLVSDVPTRIAGYAPKNFSRTYDGAVPVHRALARSLNVPAVRMLQDFGVPKFHHLLKQMGMSTLDYPPEHYGLSLILGGAEGTLWDITQIYTSFASHLKRYNPALSQTREMRLKPLTFIHDPHDAVPVRPSREMSPAAIWYMFEAMLEVNRPEDEVNWRQFTSSRKIAWKTGTSFGYRDGWAVGVTPEYVVGVWVGNADGEGRPGLIGARTAGPLLFDVFGLLDETGWFYKPVYDMQEVEVCRLSGHRAGPDCPAKTVSIPVAGLGSPSCPYHRLVHLDAVGQHRVSSRCMSVSEMQVRSWFVLPPVQEWYYRRSHVSYHPLPPFRDGCRPQQSSPVSMEIIYPDNASKIYIPKELSGKRGKTVFEVAHRSPSRTIFWHLDDRYIGETKGYHQMALSPDPGIHVLTLVDEKGETLRHRFEILAR